MKRAWKWFAGTALFVLVTAALSLWLPRPEQAPPAPQPAAVSAPAAALDAFGIDTTRYQPRTVTVRRNQTFGQLLADQDIPYPTVAALLDVAKPAFDVRNLRANKPLRFYTAQADTSAAVRYIVYAPGLVDFVFFDLGPQPRVEQRQKAVEVRQREVTGLITQSLYQTLMEGAGTPRMASLLTTKLSEIYAWQIDFFRIQQGDHFKVVYEEMLVDGKPVDLGRVLGARFEHGGKPHYAFHFEQNGQPEYFDEAGNSLRKTFLMAPVRYSRISSRFTYRRFHPVQRRYKAHLGTDYAAPYGTPIYATSAGVVQEARYKGGNGNYVKIRHNGTYTTGYLHMTRIARGIRPGTHVTQGQVIGYVGSTGLANGPHVCYRFWKNGQQVDPFRQEFPSSHPVAEADREAFTAYRDALRKTIDAPSNPYLLPSPVVVSHTPAPPRSLPVTAV